ncbi:MAG: aminopeptidase P N-terminal domain-containing protein [bacterium]
MCYLIKKTFLPPLLLLPLLPTLLLAQNIPFYQSDFPAEEFAARQAKVFEKIGKNAIAIIQGAPAVDGFKIFRQSNEFYYLCGLEVPHAYLLLDGRSKRTTLYLQHRDAARERNEGKALSAEDADLIQELTGVDAVYGVHLMARHWRRYLTKTPHPALYTPFSPAEGDRQSRDEAIGGQGMIAADPWDGRPSREGQFIHHLRTRFPQFEIHDLSPILDEMRIVKSPREIALIRRASQLAGLGLMEAMRSTKPGVMEYQLDAVARYIFLINGAQGEGYSSITAGGTNAWMGHYFHNNSVLKNGDLVLMDYAPDYRYYTSDVTRMWPVNGKFSPVQRELYGFILAYYKSILKHIRPGVTPEQVMDECAAEMEKYFDAQKFSDPIYEKACRAALTFRGHLSHPVGMAVHDVSHYRRKPLVPGTVFSIDPMIWVPEEKLYIRIEDVVVVTKDGVENFTDFVPSELDEIEKLMRQDGVLQKTPPFEDFSRLTDGR